MNVKCPYCGSAELMKNGSQGGRQQYRCRTCKRYFKEGYEPKDSIKKTKRFITKSIKNMGISVDQFRKKHDIVFILSQVMERFEEGMLYEKSDVIKMAGLSPGYSGISTVLESENFKKYSGKAGSTRYWARPELITKLTEEGIMR